jgi:hypothetical protein
LDLSDANQLSTILSSQSYSLALSQLISILFSSLIPAWLLPLAPYDAHDRLQVPCNNVDNLLFQASTSVAPGNGTKARFWHHSWLDGEAPQNLAPHFFELVKRKNK